MKNHLQNSLHILFVDHEDSFSANIVAQLMGNQLNVHILQFHQLHTLTDERIAEFDGFVISPGPGHPGNYTQTLEFISKIPKTKPVFGVCLGFQMLCHFEGCAVFQMGDTPSHGRTFSSLVNFKDFQVSEVRDSAIQTQNKPTAFAAFDWKLDSIWAYFNSLGVSPEDPCFKEHFWCAGRSIPDPGLNPESEPNTTFVTAAMHKCRPWLLTQFHPDSFGSEKGEVFFERVCKWFHECAKLNRS
jgi:anthranilate/para-aminobenzoate synthase component II